uniref:Uncharacterized protein n=1 Tax=Rhizophora mucronata TaxID=61149 RepID=A0A2P2IU17_RHIMU
MNERGVKKTPGSSMIELDGAVNEFIAGEIQAHPDAKQMYDKKELLESVKAADSVGYVAETAGVFKEDLNE